MPGLWLADNDERQGIRRILGLLVIIIAGSTLAEYAFHISLGIDQLLLRDTHTPSLSAYPGRMAIATAICFLFLGSAVMLLGLKKALALQRSLVVVSFAISLVALCGYLYGVKSLYSITPYSTMGVHTSAGLMAVCLAYFLARPNEGIVSIAASDSNSGFLVRTLVPAIVVVPILIGWLSLVGHRADLYDTPFGAPLLVLGSIGCLAALTMLVARSMYRWECESSHAEKTIRESEERFRLVADTAPALIWMSGTDKLGTYFNKPWLDFTGRSIDSELGNGWADGVHPEDLQRCLGTYTQSFDRREKFTMEYRLRRHDGEYRWILGIGVPRFDQGRSFVGYVGIGVDVTERKRTEEALQHKEMELTEAQRLAGVGSWQWDAKIDKVIWSEELYRLFGRDPKLPAPSFKEHPSLFTAESWERLQGFVKEALRTGAPYELDMEILSPESSTKWATARGEPLRDAGDQIIGLRGTVQDITERKQAEAALANVSRKLIEAQEQERSRIGRELHDDIGQRLAMLAIELQQLHENSLILPDVRSRMGELQKQISEIAADIQSLSHELHSGKLQYLGIAVAMRGFCREFGEQQKVEIDFQTHDLPSPVPPDTALCLFRVLQEALHNAAKHSGVRHFQAQLWGTSDEIHLTVSDSGSGFVGEVARESRGLGLISMEERLKLVSGTFSIESQPKRGTTIHARVPLGSGSDSMRAAG